MATVSEISQLLHDSGAQTQPAQEPCRKCGADTVEAWVQVGADDGKSMGLLFQFCVGEKPHQNLIN